MNAIELLKNDHAVVADLFEKVKATEDAKHPALFRKIKVELVVHTHIEETVFYPYLIEKGGKELRSITLEGIEEHHQAKYVLGELDDIPDGGEVFEAKLKVLIEDIEHHVKEEHNEMFPKAENEFGREALSELGAALEAEKIKFIKSDPAIAKNLVKEKEMKKKNTLENIYDKAKDVVDGVVSTAADLVSTAANSVSKGSDGKTGSAKRSSANGNGHKTKGAAAKRSSTTKKSASSSAKSGRARSGAAK